MKYKEAIDILSLSHSDLLQCTNKEKQLLYKKQFHKLALSSHPDKNDNSNASTLRFQQINEAYQFLSSSANNDNDNATGINNNYYQLLQLLLNSLLSNVEDMTIKLLKTIDISTAIFIYQVMKENELLSDIHLQKLWKLIHHHHQQQQQTYFVYPTLKDMLENNVYLLTIGDEIYTIPLWFNEVVFDNNIIVKCIPKLPEYINLDISNNIIVNVCIDKEEYQMTENISIPIYDGYTIYLSKYNDKTMYTLQNKGISIANDDNIYDIHQKTDIIIHLTIH